MPTDDDPVSFSRRVDPTTVHPKPVVPADFSAAKVRVEHEEWICERLVQWIRSTCRQPAAGAFTAGPLRQVAYAVEDVLRGKDSPPPAADLAGKTVRELPGRRSPHVELWDAINEYAESCGGDTSDRTISDRRMNAVAYVERWMSRLAATAAPVVPPDVWAAAERVEQYDRDFERRPLMLPLAPMLFSDSRTLASYVLSLGRPGQGDAT